MTKGVKNTPEVVEALRSAALELIELYFEVAAVLAVDDKGAALMAAASFMLVKGLL